MTWPRRLRPGTIPSSLKIGYAAWLAVWVPVHAVAYGFSSFFWFCALGNILVGIALWRQDSLLLSMQAVSLLIWQGLYSVDLLARVTLGRHVFGGTEYVFRSGLPLAVRLLSLFHVVMPLILFFGLARLGYDRRAFLFQTAAGWMILMTSLLFGPDANLNGVWSAPGGGFRLPWPAYFLYFALSLPTLVYWPTHRLLQSVFGKGTRHAPLVLEA